MKDNGRTTIRNSRHLKFQAAKELSVSFSDDIEVIADSDDSAEEFPIEEVNMETGSGSGLVTTRASARLAEKTQTISVE